MNRLCNSLYNLSNLKSTLVCRLSFFSAHLSLYVLQPYSCYGAVCELGPQVLLCVVLQARDLILVLVPLGLAWSEEPFQFVLDHLTHAITVTITITIIAFTCTLRNLAEAFIQLLFFQLSITSGPTCPRAIQY